LAKFLIIFIYLLDNIWTPKTAMFTKVDSVTIINNVTLLVFYTESDCWQFRLISAAGEVFGECKLYYTPEAAEKAGREWIYQGS
jgi:hypothetical protein